jgi:hypothetical protein
MTRYLAAWLTLALLLTAGANARAGLIAADSFNYQPGSTLLGQNGGTGFSGPWAAGGFNATFSSNYLVGSSSLADGNLTTSGGHVATSATSAIAGITRALSTQLGAAGTTDYVSILLRPDGPLTGGTFNNYFGLYLNSSTGNDVFFGKPGNGPITDYDVESRGGTLQADSGVAAVTGQTVLLVLRADFAAGIDKFTLYVNPTPGGTEPLSGTVKQDTDIANVSGLTLYSTGAFSADEIRVGTTYADVVPISPAAVPEPASIVLVATAGLMGIGYALRCRKRAAIA